MRFDNAIVQVDDARSRQRRIDNRIAVVDYLLCHIPYPDRPASAAVPELPFMVPARLGRLIGNAVMKREIIRRAGYYILKVL